MCHLSVRCLAAETDVWECVLVQYRWVISITSFPGFGTFAKSVSRLWDFCILRFPASGKLQNGFYLFPDIGTNP